MLRSNQEGFVGLNKNSIAYLTVINIQYFYISSDLCFGYTPYRLIGCLLSISPILTNKPRTSTSMQHPAMPIPMTPVGFPEPLSTEAEGYRRLLASWIAQAQPRVDYYYDDRGNRVYCRERISPMVQPLLRAMGLSVSQFTIVQYPVL